MIEMGSDTAEGVAMGGVASGRGCVRVWGCVWVWCVVWKKCALADKESFFSGAGRSGNQCVLSRPPIAYWGDPELMRQAEYRYLTKK